MKKRFSNIKYGFTLVELLIVIVVIAILAAVSIVAYNGIQNRANDTTVQSDLGTMAKKIKLDQVDRGGYIKGGTPLNSTAFPGFSFPVSKSAYWTDSGTNLYYCEGNISGNPVFRIAARSKSGTSFRYDSREGLSSLGNTGLNNVITCQGLDADYTWSYGYSSNPSHGWWSWTSA